MNSGALWCVLMTSLQRTDSLIGSKDEDYGIGQYVAGKRVSSSIDDRNQPSQKAKPWFVSEEPDDTSDLGCNWWMACTGLKQISLRGNFF